MPMTKAQTYLNARKAKKGRAIQGDTYTFTAEQMRSATAADRAVKLAAHILGVMERNSTGKPSAVSKAIDEL